MRICIGTLLLAYFLCSCETSVKLLKDQTFYKINRTYDPNGGQDNYDAYIYKNTKPLKIKSPDPSTSLVLRIDSADGVHRVDSQHIGTTAPPASDIFKTENGKFY